MRPTENLLFFGFLLAACPTPASADWQYTRWGMTLEEVAAASKGQLKQCTPSDCQGQTIKAATPKLFGSFQLGEFRFTAFALFDNQTNKLVQVTLTLSDPAKADALADSLRTQYGAPATQNRNAVLTLLVWRDDTDTISYVAIKSQLTAVAYTPRQ